MVRDAEEQATQEIIKGLKSHCIDFHDFEDDEVEAFFEEHDDEIRDEIRERDDSTTVNDLIKNTRDIPVRVEMLSNYDCINSCWLESQGGFRYKESYFRDMIDTLRLNPAKVKKALTDKGYMVYGRFPNKKYRDGKEQVSYEDFCQELENACCGANLLTYIGLVNLRDLYDADFKIKEVIIPKGNTCGLFSSMYGGGSLIEMELKSDVRIRLDKARKDGYGFRLRLDNERSEYDCSIKHVYGVCDFVMSYNFDDSDPMTDYFCTNFYLTLGVGTYKKPYKVELPKLDCRGKKPDVFKHPEGAAHKAIRQALGSAYFSFYNSQRLQGKMVLGEDSYGHSGDKYFWPLSYSSAKTAQKRIDKLEKAGIRCKLTGYNGGCIEFLGYTPETEALLEKERQEVIIAHRAWLSKQVQTA